VEFGSSRQQPGSQSWRIGAKWAYGLILDLQRTSAVTLLSVDRCLMLSALDLTAWLPRDALIPRTR
jgi:hypothetical protein